MRNPNCTNCELHKVAQNVCIWGEGPKNSPLMIVGQNPGSEEDVVDRPFVGRSGKLLESLLGRAGLRREEVYITNAVKCHTTKNAEPGLKSIGACSPYLNEELSDTSPRFVVALGNTALRALTGAGGTTRKSGQLLPLLPKYQMPLCRVIPTYHPAYALRNPGVEGDIVAVLQQAARLQRGEAAVTLPPIYRNPTDTTDMETARVLAFDIETNALEAGADGSRIYLLGCATDSACYVFGPDIADVVRGISVLSARISNSTRVPGVSAHGVGDGDTNGVNLRTVGHASTRYDLPYIFRDDYEGLRRGQSACDDTLLMAHLCDENLGTYRLESLAQRLVGLDAWKGDVTWNWHDTPEDEIPWDAAVEYNAKDCYSTLLLFKHLQPRLESDPKLVTIYEEIYKPATAALATVQDNGVYVRRDVLKALKALLSAEKEVLKVELSNLAKAIDPITFSNGINPNSTRKVAQLLYKGLGLKASKFTMTGQASTDELTVKRLASQASISDISRIFLDKLIQYRERNKLLSTYLLPYERLTETVPRVYPGYAITTTVTGRSSSFDPNLQNVPRDKRIRAIIGAPPGKRFMEADFNMQELRIAAHVANEEKMIAALNSGQDLHLITAASILKKPMDQVTSLERVNMGKIPNFSLLYCAEVNTFIDAAFKEGVSFSPREGSRILDAFYESWPGLDAWYSRVAEDVKATASVRSITGQLRRLPSIHSNDPSQRKEALRMAINFCVQSPAAHVSELALAMASGRLHHVNGAKIVGFIHDAIQVEYYPEDEARVAAILKDVMEVFVPWVLKEKFGVVLKVPMVADIKTGPSWGELQKYG